MVATAKSSAAIHPLLKQLHVFEDTINVLPPNKEARKEVDADAPSPEFACSPLLSLDIVAFRGTADTGL